jgi:hypothetical protein
MWRSHPSCIRSWSVLITFKSSESSKEVRPGSIEAFGYTSLWCYHKRKCCTLSFSRFAPHHGRLFRPLSPIVIGVTTVRRHDVALPSISATVFTTLKPHELAIVELRVAYTRYPTGSTDRYSPATVINGTFYPEPPIRKLHYHPSAAVSLFLFLFQLALDTLPLAHLPHLFHSSRANCSLHFRRQGEAQSRPKVEINPSCHPWLRLQKSSSRFAGHC